MKRKNDLRLPLDRGEGISEYTIILTHSTDGSRTVRICAQDTVTLMRKLREEYKVGQGEVSCKVRLG